jgi:hypothetical protein
MKTNVANNANIPKPNIIVKDKRASPNDPRPVEASTDSGKIISMTISGNNLNKPN